MPPKHTIDSPKRKPQLALMGLTISETLEFRELSKFSKRQFDEFERARATRDGSNSILNMNSPASSALPPGNDNGPLAPM